MQYIESYNLIDLFVVSTMLTGLGVWKGFVKSLTGLASLVLGVALAMRYQVRLPVLEQDLRADPRFP